MRSILVFCFSLLAITISAQNFYLFVGTYTSGASKGIYVYDFNSNTGDLKWVSNTDSSANPSFLAVAADGKHLYAVNEVSRQQSGFIASYSFDKKTGKLSFINKQSSGRENPCHVSITKNGKWVVVANYTGGSLAAFPVNADGSLQPFSQHIIHTGKGVNKERQEKAHVHSVFFSPDEKFLFSPDLGTDQVSIYQFTPGKTQPLESAANPFISAEPGSGPRHLDFSPDGKYVYLIQEMSGTVSAFSYQHGEMKLLQTIATHTPDYTGQPGSADIHLSPDGKFLYASNRGQENNIAIFSVNTISGKLTPAGYQSTNGVQPRNFIIDPSGRYLLVANQKTSNIVVFKRDSKTGQLTATGKDIEVPNPVCLKMVLR